MQKKHSGKAEKAKYKALLQQESVAAPGAGPPREKPRRGAGVLLYVLIVVLLLVAALLAILLFRPQMLGVQGEGLGFGLAWPGQGADEGQPAAPDGSFEPLLQQTADAGQRYVDETVFVGDSNTVRMWLLGLVQPEQVLAESSIGIDAVTSLAIAQPEGAGSKMTIERAVARLQPKRILITMGTNDIGNIGAEAFIRRYEAALDALQAASPNSIIVVNAIPPVCEANSYDKVENEGVQAFNSALEEMCAGRQLPFLNSYEALTGDDGYMPGHYADGDGLHLTEDALEAMLSYYRTHAYKP